MAWALQSTTQDALVSTCLGSQVSSGGPNLVASMGLDGAGFAGFSGASSSSSTNPDLNWDLLRSYGKGIDQLVSSLCAMLPRHRQ